MMYVYAIHNYNVLIMDTGEYWNAIIILCVYMK